MTPDFTGAFTSRLTINSALKRGDVGIAGTGAYLPEIRLTNSELARRLNVTPDWIERRTGICERRIAPSGQAASDLAVHAGRNALENSDFSPSDIDFLVVATTSPDTLMPSTACRVQHALGLKQVAALDISASCSGFAYALQIARGQILSGLSECALVIATEVRSRFVNPNDLDTAILYGDGAGAAILTLSAESGITIREIILGANGAGASVVEIPAGGSREPATLDTIKEFRHTIRFEKIPLIRSALRTMMHETHECLKRSGIKPDEISSIIPHQMSGRLIDSLAEHMGFSSTMMVNLAKFYGNVAGASSAIALDHWAKTGLKDKPITRALLVAFGGGYTWGTVLLEKKGLGR